MMEEVFCLKFIFFFFFVVLLAVSESHIHWLVMVLYKTRWPRSWEYLKSLHNRERAMNGATLRLFSKHILEK